MASNVTFIGGSRCIIVNSGLSSITAQVDLYSEWKVYALSADNLKFGEVFRTIGGDPIGGGQFAGAYFFLQNQDVVTPSATSIGWRIRPDERDHELRIDGNVFGEDATEQITTATSGAFTVLIRLNTSQLTQAIETGALSAGERAQLSSIESAVSAQTSQIIVNTSAISALDSSIDLLASAISSVESATLQIDVRTDEMHRYWGLNASSPLVISATQLSAGGEITQAISTAGGTTTVSRL